MMFLDLTEDEDLIEIMKELKESGRKIAKSVKRSQSNSSRTYVNYFNYPFSYSIPLLHQGPALLMPHRRQKIMYFVAPLYL